MMRPKTYVARAPMNATRPDVVSPIQRSRERYVRRTVPACTASRIESSRVRIATPAERDVPRRARPGRTCA